MSGKTENIVTAIEKKYNVKAIESIGQGMWYLNYQNGKLGILTVNADGEKTCVVLEKSQAMMLLSELKDVIEVVFD